MTDFRPLLRRMAAELDYLRQLLRDDRREIHALAAEARVALAQPPADGEVPAGLLAVEYFHVDSGALIVSEPSEEGSGGCWIVRNCRHVNPCTEFPTLAAAWEALNGGPSTPQPQPSADDEVAKLVQWLRSQDGGLGKRAIHSRIADLLERQPQPVPVSERLPEAGDCTAQGWCWVLYQGFATWTLEPPLGQDGKHTGYTYWLPAHALPLPGEVE